MQLILFEPEIPQNSGTLIRMCTCFNITLGIIEPAAFLFSDRKFKRAGMDYVDLKKIRHYSSFKEMKIINRNKRIILLDTKATTKYYDIQYKNSDIIMAGKESTGVPEDVYNKSDLIVHIPMINGARSLNLAISAAIVVSEAQRQLGYSAIHHI